MSKCPYCNEKLNYVNYTSYYDPPEWYQRCINPKCGKYEISYFYYDGYRLKLNKWKKANVDDDSLELQEFHNRIRYIKKLKSRLKNK